MLLRQAPQTKQPQRFAELNRSHWLARDILFIHSGTQAFWRGVPIEPISDTAPRGFGAAGAAVSPFSSALGFIPDGAGLLTYAIDLPGWTGYTFSVWQSGTAASVNAALMAVGSDSSSNALIIRRTTTEQISASTLASASTSAATSINSWSANTWQHGVGSFTSSTLRKVYRNGANSATNTTARSPASLPDRLSLLTARYNGGNTDTATTVITGVHLPMLINRVLDDDEVQRLYTEQLTNPWGIFAPRRIWIPVSIPSSGTTYTITPSGGVVMGGTSVDIKGKVLAVSGGVTLAGTGSMSFTSGGTTYTITPSGGITMGGSATYIQSKTFIPSGGITLGGTSDMVKTKIIAPTDGVILGGTGSMTSNTVVVTGTVGERTKVGAGT